MSPSRSGDGIQFNLAANGQLNCVYLGNCVYPDGSVAVIKLNCSPYLSCTF